MFKEYVLGYTTFVFNLSFDRTQPSLIFKTSKVEMQQMLIRNIYINLIFIRNIWVNLHKYMKNLPCSNDNGKPRCSG